jgi:2-haloacid dehalogenase
MLNLGKNKIPEYNFDDAHEFSLKEIVKEYNLEKFNEEDIFNISYNTPHSFKCWEDFPRNLIEFKKQFITVSFTILSYKIIIDNAKYNNISWDAIFSCEGIGKYKILPEAYLSVAKYLQLNVSECMMVACHNFDLDAAKKVGFQTAFVKRVDEWGEESPPDPNPNPNHDIIVENFDELKDILKK